MDKVRLQNIGNVVNILNMMLLVVAVIVLPIWGRSEAHLGHLLTAIDYNKQASSGGSSADPQRTQSLNAALPLALSNNDVRLAMQLITRGADVDLRVPNVDKRSDLWPDSMMQEIRSGKPPTILMYAIAHRQGKLVDLLLKRGAAVDLTGSYLVGGAQDYDEHRELMKVFRYATKHHIKSIGWDPDFPPAFWYADITPLHLAVYQQNPSLVARLIRCGANVNAKASGDQTALQLAVTKGSFAIVKLLIGHNCLVDAQDQGGFTALKLAANLGERKIYVFRQDRQTGATMKKPST